MVAVPVRAVTLCNASERQFVAQGRYKWRDHFLAGKSFLLLLEKAEFPSNCFLVRPRVECSVKSFKQRVASRRSEEKLTQVTVDPCFFVKPGRTSMN